MPKTFETCEPAVYVKSAYPRLLADFEEEVNAKLRAKKKPAGTRKAATKAEKMTQEQPAITNFFAQNKVATKRTVAKPKAVPETEAVASARADVVQKSVAPEKDVGFRKNEVLPNSVPPASKPVVAQRPVASSRKPSAPKAVKNLVSAKSEAAATNRPNNLAAKAPAPPAAAAAAVHKSVLRLQQPSASSKSFSDMSIDPSDDSYNSDLSMIVDDFISRKVGELKIGHKAPDLSAPVVTSTPRNQTARDTIRKTGLVAEALPEFELEEIEKKVPAASGNDFSMTSVNDPLEDSYDRMCK